MIKTYIDPEACIDSEGNVVYVDQSVITVTPNECKELLYTMMGG